MKHEENNRSLPVGKSVKGSAIYGEDGSYVFTPYAESKPENANWLPLATVENGKLECSKKRIRMVLTMDRADMPLVRSTFIRAFGQLSRKSEDSRVLKMYKAAAKQRPNELNNNTNQEPSSPLPAPPRGSDSQAQPSSPLGGNEGGSQQEEPIYPYKLGE